MAQHHRRNISFTNLRFKFKASKSISCLVILCIPTLYFPWGQAFAAAKASVPNPPVQAVRLTQIEGPVSVNRSGASQWEKAVASDALSAGDHLYVDRGGRVELQMQQVVVRAGSYTNLSVTRLSNDFMQLALSQGTLHVRTFLLSPGNTVEVDTPNGAITVKQPGDFRVDCYTSDGGTVVAVNTGEVELRGPNLSASFGTGKSVRLTGTNPITSTALAMAGKDPFDIWSQQRDHLILRSQPGFGAKEQR